jgi:hypothetical protein
MKPSCRAPSSEELLPSVEPDPSDEWEPVEFTCRVKVTPNQPETIAIELGRPGRDISLCLQGFQAHHAQSA